jgi:HAD superfamily hydrolase (TIGR01509 family)
MRKTLLFDLGGVVIHNTGFERLNALLSEPLAAPALKQRWLASDAVRAFELGKVPAEVFAQAFTAEWKLRCPADAFIAEFATWPKGLYPGAATLLARLRRRHRTACLTNSNARHWQGFGGFSEHFDHALSSHLLGVIKPDIASFRRALAVLEAEPGGVTFFDDSEQNIQAAARIGIHAIHVDGFDELLRAVAREKLLP